MDHRSSPASGTSPGPHSRAPQAAAPPRTASATSVWTDKRWVALLRGLVFGGIAYLLGGCPLLFNTLPLGLALLCASSRHTWYILIGLILSSLRGTTPLSAWIQITVYTLAVLLRLAIQCFVDVPPTASGEERSTLRRREWQELSRHWRALKAMVSRRTAAHPEGAAVPHEASADPDAPPEPPSRRRLFSESPILRMLTGSVCGFLTGLCGMLAGGFAFYDLFAALFTILCVPAATFLFIPCFREEGQALLFAPRTLSDTARGGTELYRRVAPLTLVSGALLVLTVVYAARGHVLTIGTPYLTLRMSPLLAMLLTLGASAHMGVVPAITVALLGGLGSDPLTTPAYILAAMAYLLLGLISSRMAAVGSVVVALSFCALVGGTPSLSAHFLTLLLAIPLHLTAEHMIARIPVLRRSTLPADAELSSYGGTADFSAAVIHRARAKAHRAHLRALSDAFSSLSRLFYDMSDRLRHPRMADIHRLCEEALEERCAVCPHHTACRGGSHDRAQEIAARITVQLRMGGTVSADALPHELRAQCPHLDELLARVNARNGEMAEQRLRSEKTEVFADDYRAMADILDRSLMEDMDEEGEAFQCDHAAARHVLEYLTGLGLQAKEAVVCGTRERSVTVRGIHMEAAAAKAEEIRTALGEICGTRLSLPDFDVCGDFTVMRLESLPTLNVSFAGSTVTAGATEGDVLPEPLTGETADGTYLPPYTCGDHIALFTGERAYFYALISDGMGSGEEASLTSDICAVFLERMLSAGNRPETSIGMLSSFIRQKNTGTGGECSATVDLMELDLFDGNAVFFKNGAAPTYVVRKGTVYKLRSRTMPIGILKDTPPELLRFRTHPGDVVVMVSDGVTLGNDECPWLIDMLSDPLPQSMDSLRLDILKHAIASGSPDDLSAIAVRVEEASGMTEAKEDPSASPT